MAGKICAHIMTEMKKIIIVNNNMKVGGVQKSLYNLLWETEGKYEVTLLLFRAVGEYVDKLPDSVKIVECESLFRYLGVSQGECRGSLPDAGKRAVLAGISRLFGRSAAMRILLRSQKPLAQTYDCAISFLQNGRPEAFYGGTQDFVLNCISADRKIAFLHCDYANCGANHEKNNIMVAQFDAIAACSDGCRRSFIQSLPELTGKCVTVRNFHRIEEVRLLAEQDAIQYEADHLNVVMVSRLSHEKGIDRAITATAEMVKRGINIQLHIVGSGAMEESLRTLAETLGVKSQVRFYGEQGNPYRFVKNADLFLLTSYHEAAPMVIEEARCLGVPVLTTQTTSSREMVTEEDCGWVCENSQQALEKMLGEILAEPEMLRRAKIRLRERPIDNTAAMKQFATLIEG